MESLHGLECAAQALAFYGIPVTLNVVDEVPDSLGRVALAQRDLVKSDVVFGPLMRENVAVVMSRIDRLRKEHVLLTEQPYRHLEQGMPSAKRCRLNWKQLACLPPWWRPSTTQTT